MRTMSRSRSCVTSSPCSADRSPGPRYTPTDRIVLATLAKLLPRDRWKIFLVTPSTLLRWHRELVRRRWTYRTTGRRRVLDPEVVDLVLRLARDHPRWGYLRIVGECRKLGVSVSATSVRTILHRHRLGPAPRGSGPTWTEFTRRPARRPSVDGETPTVAPSGQFLGPQSGALSHSGVRVTCRTWLPLTRAVKMSGSPLSPVCA
jgi:transposase